MSNPFVWPPVNLTPNPSSGGWSQWRPDQPPLAPNARDDEMQSTVVLPKWTEWDPGNVGVFSMDTVRKQMKCVTSGLNEKVCGVWQAPPPATPYVVYAKASIVTSTIPTDNTWMGAGILIGRDLQANPATSTFRTIGVNNVPGGIKGQYGSAYNWANYTSLTSFLDAPPAGIYQRARVNGANLWLDFSPDGQSWFNLYFEALGWNPAQIGLFATCYGNTAPRTLEARYSFFRVFPDATAAFNTTAIGRYMDTL